MTDRLLLARLGGAQTDLLRRTENDVPKYTAMGGVLLSTAAVAAASAAYALTTTLGLPVSAALLVGLAWGVVILNLDRMLIVSMGRQNSLTRNLLAALPRLALAVFIGAVISTPLVLRIFQPEINNELVTMQSEDRLHAQQEQAREFAAIPQLEARFVQLTAEASGQSRPAVEQEPDVVAAQRTADDRNADLQTKEEAVSCEKSGRTCAGATGTPGDGDEYRSRVRARDDARTSLEQAQAQLRATKDQAAARLATSAGMRQQEAQRQLPQARAQLEALRAERDRAYASSTDAANSNTGLLARLEALDRLSGNNPLMWSAHLALFLLFMSIEVLPVLVKLLSSFGAPNTYERLVDGREQEVLDDEERQADDRRLAARDDSVGRRERARVRLEIERDRAQQQIDAGKEGTGLLMETQKAITARAITVWGQVAAARSDDELLRWYQAHGGRGPLPGSVAASGASNTTASGPVLPTPGAPASGSHAPVQPSTPMAPPVTPSTVTSSGLLSGSGSLPCVLGGSPNGTQPGRHPTPPHHT